MLHVFLELKEHDCTWDPLIKEQQFVSVACLRWWVILHSQAAGGVPREGWSPVVRQNLPKDWRAAWAVCPLSPREDPGLLCSLP